MNPALLLPLMLAADSLGIESAVPREEPPVQLWISNDQRFLPGERAKVQVQIEDDSYLLVLQVDPEGYVRVLFPLDPDKDNFARGGKKYEVKGRGGHEAFEAEAKGRGAVYAAVSREPFHFDGFVVGDHWDYKALAPSRLSTNPESELNDLVRRMAQSDFDYDIMNYEVVERSTYASEYYPGSSGGGYADSWCCGQSYYGSPFSLSVSFGYPYRHYYYDPYYYAYYPFYNPFYYTPYYYAPVYYPRYVYPRPYYNSPYGNGYYPYGNGNYRNRYQGYGQGFTPYRFRGFGGDRGRGNGFQGVGGVYHPGNGFQGVGGVYRPGNGFQGVGGVSHPVHFPVHEPGVARPVRHIPDRPADPLPNGVAKRSLIDDDRRVQSRPVEAHRARPDDRDDRSAGEPRLVRREVEARRSGDNRSGDNRRADAPGTRGSDAQRQSGGRTVDRSGPQSRPSNPGRGAPPPSSSGSRGGGEPRTSGGHPQGGGAPQGGGDHPSGDGGRRHR